MRGVGDDASCAALVPHRTISVPIADGAKTGQPPQRHPERELVDRRMPTNKAVAERIKSTAGVITSAGRGHGRYVPTGSSREMKQLGVALAVAILIDATIVRAVLLPATMKLLGSRNWCLPKRLQWLAEVRARAGRSARRA